MTTPAESEPWYKDGLHFKCTQCGNCCTGSPGFVWVDDAEIQAIADYLGKTIGEVRLMHTRPARGKISLNEYANGDCVFFDGKGRGCTIYPVRPKQCRTWPFWNSNLESEDDWDFVKTICPGTGRGDFVPFDEIEIRRSAIDL